MTLRAIDGGKKGKPASSVSTDPVDSESTFPMSDFLTPAQDSKGHSAKIAAKVPPGMKYAIAVLVQSNRYPWDTDSAFVRWCVAQGLASVAKHAKDPEFHSQQKMLGAWTSSWRLQREQIEFQNVLDGITGTVKYLVGQGHLQAARKLAQEIEQQVGELPDPYWRERYERGVRELKGLLAGK